MNISHEQSLCMLVWIWGKIMLNTFPALVLFMHQTALPTSGNINKLFEADRVVIQYKTWHAITPQAYFLSKRLSHICFCFVFPRYNSLVTGRRAKGIIAVCWILSVVIGLTPMFGWNTSIDAGTNSSCPQGMTECLFEKVVTMGYMVYFNFFGCILIPLFAMLAIYTWIFTAARRQLRQMEKKLAHLQGHAHREGSSSRSTLQKEVHAAKSLAIIVGLFAVCWLPLHIINCFTLFCPQCDRPQDWVMYLAIILSHANSVINPFIYAYRIRDFRQTFRRIIRQHFLWHENRLAIGNSNGGMTASSAAVSVIETSCTMSNGYVMDASNSIPGMISCDNFIKELPAKIKPQEEFQNLGYSLNGTLEHSFPANSTPIFSLGSGEEVSSVRDHVEITTVKDSSDFTNVQGRCLAPVRTSNSSGLAEVSWHTLLLHNKNYSSEMTWMGLVSFFMANVRWGRLHTPHYPGSGKIKLWEDRMAPVGTLTTQIPGVPSCLCRQTLVVVFPDFQTSKRTCLLTCLL